MNIHFFGGTGGLGSPITKVLEKNHVVSNLGSEIDVTNESKVSLYFKESTVPIDVVIFFANYNDNKMMHKQDKGEHQVDVNINGLNNVLRHCLPIMRENEFGRIIIASSVLLEIPIVGTAIYTACKGYSESIVKTLAKENAQKGITANCLRLGYMDGGLTYTIPEHQLEGIKKSIPANRFGKIEEIASAIEFLIQNEYVNGSTIKIAGGL